MGVAGGALVERLATTERASTGYVDLVRRAQTGDEAAFARLVDLHVDRMLRIALGILREDADARDAVQDAFVRAWRDLPRLREAIAAHGLAEAVARDHELARGVNVVDGRITYAAVAEAHDFDFTPLEDVLPLSPV